MFGTTIWKNICHWLHFNQNHQRKVVSVKVNEKGKQYDAKKTSKTSAHTPQISHATQYLQEGCPVVKHLEDTQLGYTLYQRRLGPYPSLDSPNFSYKLQNIGFFITN